MKWGILFLIVAILGGIKFGYIKLSPKWASQLPGVMLPDASTSRPVPLVDLTNPTAPKFPALSSVATLVPTPPPAISTSTDSSASSSSTPAAPSSTSGTHTILDCSFDLPAGWAINSETDTKFSARSEDKGFDVTTMPYNRQVDVNSASFSNLIMLIEPKLNAKTIAEERSEPFQGHEAYRALLKRDDDEYRGVVVFSVGNTRYFVATLKKGSNPLNDSELIGIVDSCRIIDPPTH